MADSMIVGNFVGEDALAAVGASYALTNVFIMIAIGGGNGASVLTSQYLGARQHGKMKTSISTALITFLAVSLVLGGLGFAMNGTILTVLNTPENIMGQARLYLGIYFLGLPFLFMYNVLAAIFNVLGDSRTPLYLLIFSSILNVVLDIISVTWLGMGVDGVAIATVMAQGISALISFSLLLKKLKGYDVHGRMFSGSMTGPCWVQAPGLRCRPSCSSPLSPSECCWYSRLSMDSAPPPWPDTPPEAGLNPSAWCP